ncbi:hypothetical protein [Streptomyces sp. NPDC002346]
MTDLLADRNAGLIDHALSEAVEHRSPLATACMKAVSTAAEIP